MACDEVSKAIDWAQKDETDRAYIHPVHAYFTKHFGYDGQFTAKADAVHYVEGTLRHEAAPTPHLVGVLETAFTNKAGMVASESLSYYVEVYPGGPGTQGTLKYQQRSNSQPVGGLPPKEATVTCVGGKLLTGVAGTEVVTIGVALGEKYKPGPK